MSKLLSAVALVGFVAGLAGGMFLGFKADAWLAAHPGPCLVSPEECEAYGKDRPASMVPIFMGLFGGMAGSFLFMVPLVAWRPSLLESGKGDA